MTVVFAVLSETASSHESIRFESGILRSEEIAHFAGESLGENAIGQKADMFRHCLKVFSCHRSTLMISPLMMMTRTPSCGSYIFGLSVESEESPDPRFGSLLENDPLDVMRVFPQTEKIRRAFDSDASIHVTLAEPDGIASSEMTGTIETGGIALLIDARHCVLPFVEGFHFGLRPSLAVQLYNTIFLAIVKGNSKIVFGHTSCLSGV